MIYFVTNEPQHLIKYRKKLYDNIEVLKDDMITYAFFIKQINKMNNLIGYDVESNGLDAYTNNTVLKIVGNEEIQFIFHTPYVNVRPYFKYLLHKDFTFLGHNIKFDIKFSVVEDEITITKVYDTMLAEQRLYMKSGLSVALASLVTRYIDVYPDAMDKRIRDEFIDCDIHKFKVEPRHLLYGANDIIHLFPIKKKQEELMIKYNLTNLVHKIEFPLISIIAKAELAGFEFNSKQWLEIYYENLAEKFTKECELDYEVRSLRDKILKDNKDRRVFMIGGKWDNIRKHNKDNDIFNANGTTNVLDLFGEPMSSKTLTGLKKKVDLAPNNINYGSESQIIEIFGRLEEPLLTKTGMLVTPQFTKTQKVEKTTYAFTTGTPAFHSYLSQMPNSIMKSFIELLVVHRGLKTACDNFGINFISKINPITKRIHTTFRQCFAETGRMQSGGGKLEPDKYNAQNIPSKAKYAIRMRNCFMSKKGYSIGTHDLSGAELIIMCSLSQDMHLLEASKGDMHSHVAQNCWRRIYNYRAHKLVAQHNALRERLGKEYRDEALIKEINLNINLAKTYVVDKTCKKVRTAFKPMTFGVIYGMRAGKAGKTLHISTEEGQIVIDFIVSEYPAVIKMVENASAFARKYGYVILNSRTSSRAWFPGIIEANRDGLDFTDYNTRQAYKALSMKVNSEESEARNIKIQGTQADMIKECSVELQQWIDNNGYTDEITLLSWIHDEVVDEHPDYLNGKSTEWIEWSKTNNLFFTNDKDESIKVSNFPELKRLLMIEVCNRYLHNVEMDVDYEVEKFRTK